MSSKKGKQNKQPEQPHNYELEIDGYETASSDEDLFAALLGDKYDTGVVKNGANNPLLTLLNINELSPEDQLPDADLPPGAFEDPFAHTELVLKFNHTIHPSALKWFIERVTSKKSKGGAELLLRREPYMGHKKEGLVVHVTAADWRQLEVAEMLELKKMDYNRDDPMPREFKLAELGKFLAEDMNVHELLSPAEKQMVVLHELQNLKSRPRESHVPGYNKIELLPGDSLFHVYVTNNLITSSFALHEADELTKLKGQWFWGTFDKLPFEGIRSYFGDRVCLYFNFVAFYSVWLIVPALLGLTMAFLPVAAFNTSVIYFCFLNMMIVTLFLISWQRKCSELTFRWGTLKMNRWEEARANYDGVLAIDPVTGKFQRWSASYKTGIKLVFGSGLVSVFCIGISLFMLYSYLDLDIWVKKFAAKRAKKAEDEWMEMFWKYLVPAMPGIGYAGCVFTANKLFRVVANSLTEWENHRTQTQFHRHLVLKMVVFEVFNSFAILFYTAFVTENTAYLRERVYTMLCVTQLLITLNSCIMPVIFRSGRIKMQEFLESPRNSKNEGGLLPDLKVLFGGGRRNSKPYPLIEEWLRHVEGMEVMDSNDPRVKMSKVEANMDLYNYQADFEDYFLLLQQFGYVFLYSSVYPPAALVAFFGNMFLLPASLYKLRQVYQRPYAKRVSNIGAWKQAFEAMSIIAVMTNCALLCTNANLRKYATNLSHLQWVFLFVLMEHAVLFLHFMMRKMIPKVSYSIKVALAAYEFRFREAIQRSQAVKNRKRATKLFTPINDQLHASDQDIKKMSNDSSDSKKRKSSEDKHEPENQKVAKVDKKHNEKAGSAAASKKKA